MENITKNIKELLERISEECTRARVSLEFEARIEEDFEDVRRQASEAPRAGDDLFRAISELKDAIAEQLRSYHDSKSHSEAQQEPPKEADVPRVVNEEFHGGAIRKTQELSNSTTEAPQSANDANSEAFKENIEAKSSHTPSKEKVDPTSPKKDDEDPSAQSTSGGAPTLEEESRVSNSSASEANRSERSMEEQASNMPPATEQTPREEEIVTSEEASTTETDPTGQSSQASSSEDESGIATGSELEMSVSAPFHDSGSQTSKEDTGGRRRLGDEGTTATKNPGKGPQLII